MQKQKRSRYAGGKEKILQGSRCRNKRQGALNKDNPVERSYGDCGGFREAKAGCVDLGCY